MGGISNKMSRPFVCPAALGRIGKATTTRHFQDWAEIVDNRANTPAVEDGGVSPGMVAIPLSSWNSALDQAMVAGDFERAGQLAETLLRYLPRHLATYQRLVHMSWELKRWDEGEDWGRRLLQADPSNVWAWRALARAAEQRGKRAQAHAIWQRAFELSPFDAEVRAGLSRTSLDGSGALALNLACLAALYLRGRRWWHAEGTYRLLVKAEPRRIDFQMLLMATLWFNGKKQEAYLLARHLLATHPYLIVAWVLLGATGDENDQALAENPISSLDPDGDYVQALLGEWTKHPAETLLVKESEAGWLHPSSQAPWSQGLSPQAGDTAGDREAQGNL
jgi:tetratricopeptide (TPR) repeat protein